MRATATYEVEGLVFEWLDVEEGSPVVGRSIGQERIRTRTGASVVAVIRQPQAVPAPEPHFVIEAGDTLVVAGTAEGIEKARDLIESGCREPHGPALAGARGASSRSWR